MYIFKQAKNAILYFDKYPELLKTSLIKVIFYAIFFIFILNFIYSSSPFISYYFKTKGFNNFVETYIPDFKVVNNKLVFDKYNKINTPLDITFIFDPEENNTINKEDKKNVNNTILKFTPNNLISSNLNITIPISNILKTFNIKNKTDLKNIKIIIIISNFITFIFLTVFLIIFDISGLIISVLFIDIIAKFYKLKFIPSALLKLAIYVNTTPYILKIIFSMFKVSMPFFIYIGIILSYLHFIFKEILINTKITEKNIL